MWEQIAEANCRGEEHRRTGWGGVKGGSWHPKIRADTTFTRAKDNTFVWLTVSLNGTSIHLPEIHFGWGNKGDIHRIGSILLYDRQKIGSAIVHFYFFIPGGAAWEDNLRSPFGQNSDPPNGCWPVRLWWRELIAERVLTWGRSCA